MKKLTILLLTIAMIGCTKEQLPRQEEIKPVDVSKVITPNTNLQ